MPLKPIQGDPLGLLSMLELKTRGANPSELADLVSPVIDVTRSYLLRDRVNLSGGGNFIGPIAGTATVIGLTTGALLTPIPSDEVWFVHKVSGQIAFNAADRVNGNYGGIYSSNGGSEQNFWGVSTAVNWVASATLSTLHFSEIFNCLMPPRTIWGAFLGDATTPAGNRAFSIWAEVTRLKI